MVVRGAGPRRFARAPVVVGVMVLVTLVVLASTAVQGTRAADAAPQAKAKAKAKPAKARCNAPATTPPEGPSAAAEVVQKAGDGKPQIAMVRYPRPDREPGGSNPWSQWGQGLVLRDGRFLSAIGDHAGVDGNSYLFVYEPTTEKLTRFADVLAQVDHETGAPGYGKIHGQIVPGRCGDAYFATYWGDRDELDYRGSYEGDLLFRIELSTLELEPLGAPVKNHGIPSLAGIGDGLLYGEAVDPAASETAGRDVGAFFVYDTRTRKVVFRSDDEDHSLFRNVMVDGRGRAYVAAANGALLEYEPGASELSRTDLVLPANGRVRASTPPAPDGTVYGVTQAGRGAAARDRFFALAPDGELRTLGPARGYTASLAMEPDGSRLYYVPGAHGDSYTQGTPVVAVDTETGKETVVANLNPLAEEQLGLTLGGSYDVALDAERRVLYVGLNAGPERDDPWNEVVLAIVSLPS